MLFFNPSFLMVDAAVCFRHGPLTSGVYPCMALNKIEFDHRAVSIPLLERLWIYFRKMNIPLPEQPYITNFGIRARLLWCDPGQQRWLFLPTVDSTTTSHASHIRPSFAMTTFTTRLPTPMSENWLRQLQPHIWLPSLATTTSTPAMSTPSPSSLHIEHQYRLTSSMSEFWAQLAWSGFSCNHCLFTFSTLPAISMFQQTEYWVAPMHCNVINLFSYLCFPCCRWPRKRPFVFRTS